MRRFTTAVVVALGAALVGCAPTLVVTRAHAPVVDADSIRRVAVQVKGSPSLVRGLKETLSRSLAETGRFELVPVQEDGTPQGPIDGWVRAEAEQASVSGGQSGRTLQHGAAQSDTETRVIVEVAFELVKTDGTVMAKRRHDAMKSAAGPRTDPLAARVFQDATEERLVRDATDECVREFVKELVPAERTDRFELVDDGALKEPVQRALAGDRAGAQAAIESHLTLHPDDAAAHYDLGVLLEAQGELDSARRHYERATALAKKPLYEKALADVTARVTEPRRRGP
jgi:hypothetical protein